MAQYGETIGYPLGARITGAFEYCLCACVHAAFASQYKTSASMSSVDKSRFSASTGAITRQCRAASVLKPSGGSKSSTISGSGSCSLNGRLPGLPCSTFSAVGLGRRPLMVLERPGRCYAAAVPLVAAIACFGRFGYGFLKDSSFLRIHSCNGMTYLCFLASDT